MLYAYVRVSSKDQNLDRQIEFINEKYPNIPKENFYDDKQSGKDFNRENYLKLKEKITFGDEIIVKELDRFGRNKDAIKEELKYFKEHGVAVRILDIPTTLIDYQGQQWVCEMITNILVEVLGSMAEQERIKIKTRQAEGIKIAKEKGIKFGRPYKMMSNFKNYVLRVKNNQLTVVEACKELGISRSQWYLKVKEV